MVDSRGAGAKPNGIPMKSYLHPSHMIRMSLLSWRHSKKWLIEVADVDLGHVDIEAETVSHRVQALHLEVLVLDALVGLPQVDTSSYLVGDLVGNREEC